jgi:transcriptional regulator with XRE-family HTH domain
VRSQKLDDQIEQLIARRIRTERVFAGLRQVDLAACIGVSQPALSRIERGERSVGLAEIVRIAIQLGLPIETFIDPPRGVDLTGWERRPTVPLVSRQLEEAALAGELPDDHPMYE